MATALFITNDDLVRNTLIDGSVDVSKFVQFLKLGQEIHIQNYLGTKLYDRISADIIANTLTNPYLLLVNEYIKPMLIHFAMVDYLPFAAYTVANGGVYKHRSENSELVTKEEVDYLVEKHRGFAQFYTRRFIDYMTYHQADFPEYNAATNEDMYPDKMSNFTGWVI
tara:strand:- start:448 stop:948 length:501 start_codon:yes stop_codon:yes gene_type:complete